MPLGTLATGARVVHVLLLGLWMGGVVSFGLLRERAEAVLPSWHLADTLLRDLLGWLDAYGLVAGPLLLVTLLAGWVPLQVPLRGRVVAVVGATLVAAVSGRWLAPRKAALIAELGRRLDDVDPSAPRAIELAQLDQVGSSLLVALGVLTAGLMVAAVRGSRPRRRFGIEL